MNATDQRISGQEPIVREIEEDQGVLEAERFVNMFNNACSQFAGFEDTLLDLMHTRSFVIAPITNLSNLAH